MSNCNFEFCKQLPTFGLAGEPPARCDEHKEEGMILDSLLFRTHNSGGSGYMSYANTVGHDFASECLHVKEKLRPPVPERGDRPDDRDRRDDGGDFQRVGRDGRDKGKGGRDKGKGGRDKGKGGRDQGKGREYDPRESRYGSVFTDRK